MRIGLLADLHYGFGAEYDRIVERLLETAVGPAACDVLLIAGDVAEMVDLAAADLGSHHRDLLTRARAAAGCPVAFCSGNHDIWSSDPAIDSWRVYREVLAEAAARTGTTYLDAGNLSRGSVTVVGCYGHFDYSLAVPDLIVGGRRVTDADYACQTPPGYPNPIWMDSQNIRWSFDDARACAAICEAGMARLESALAADGAASAILLLSHGVPRPELNGHRDRREPVSQFLHAFSGTRRLEAMVRRAVAAGARVLSVSGHTHKAVPRITIDGADYLNVGGTYGKPRLVVESFGD